MATKVIMPALGMAQETGRLLTWLKAEGERVNKGDPLMEVETDKATLEVEATASGTLSGITAAAGDDVPVGQVIAFILANGEALPTEAKSAAPTSTSTVTQSVAPMSNPPTNRHAISPVAARIAAEQGVDLALVTPRGGRIDKTDVLAYLDGKNKSQPRLLPASPLARQLAADRNMDLADLNGSGPEGAVLAADVLTAEVAIPAVPQVAPDVETVEPSTIWRIMAERTTHSWTTIPHFYLLREVNASRLIAWRERVKQRTQGVTYTDLLVALVAAALREHPRLNATWGDGRIQLNRDINIGLAVAVEDGLVVPVIHRADELGLKEIAARRKELVEKAQAKRLRPEEIADGTFTISNLGMYGVDAFNAIVNSPHAAILAVGRIAERVMPINGQPAVQPSMFLNLSCDHRVVDGARGAQFLTTLAELVEEPLGLLS